MKSVLSRSNSPGFNVAMEDIMRLAERQLSDATGCDRETIREFLNSFYGGHFADAVIYQIRNVGLQPEDAIKQAIKCWHGENSVGGIAILI